MNKPKVLDLLKAIWIIQEKGVEGFNEAAGVAGRNAAIVMLVTIIAAKSPELSLTKARAKIEEVLDGLGLYETGRYSFQQIGCLTPREKQVAELLSEGASNKEIARRLGISPRTVEDHRKNIMNKLCVSNACELVRLFMEMPREQGSSMPGNGTGGSLKDSRQLLAETV